MENAHQYPSEQNSGNPTAPPPEAEPQVVFYDSYDHGFTNGLLKIPKEHFEEFIHENGQKRLARVGLANMLDSIEEHSIQMAQTRQRLLHLKNMVISSEQEIALGKIQQTDLYAKTEEEKAHHDRVEKERSNLVIEYNWLNVAIFIAVGLAFVIADFTITLDVLHHGLDMMISRAIPLAIAVSGITFVLKPTIDRLFEKPYLREDKRKKHGLLISVSLVALVVLGFLGYFREEYLRSDNYKQAIDLDISRLNRQVDTQKELIVNFKRQGRGQEASEAESQVQKFEKEIEGQKKAIAKNRWDLSSNKVLFWIFILGNMLFALAGAICLSIAFPAADRLRRKRLLRKKQTWLGNGLVQLGDKLSDLQNKIKDHQIARDQAGNEIQMLPDLAALGAQHQVLLSKLDGYRQEATEHDTRAEAALYREAYERGNICEFGDKLIFSTSQISVAIRRGSSGAPKRPTRNNNGGYSTPNNPINDEKESEGDERYLHQQIRNLIEYNHRRKKHLLNGEDD